MTRPDPARSSVLPTVTLALTLLTLLPSGAHILEMPRKLALDRDAYFTVQQIYAGWSLFGIVIVATIAANLAVFALARRRAPSSARRALVAAGLVALSLGLFFVLVFPANQATENWTTMPPDWDALRLRWEIGHAVNALIVFAASLFAASALAEWRAAR